MATPDDATLTTEYGKGFKMLKKMGFKTGTGLGPVGREGIVIPLEVAPRVRKNEGLQELIIEESSSSAPVKWTAADQAILDAHTAVESLCDRKKNLQYKLWALKEEEIEDDSDDWDMMLRDVEVLREIIDWDLLRKYADALRDKYSAWYLLEEVIASAARAVMSIDLDNTDIVSELRELVLDDDLFDRIVLTVQWPPTTEFFHALQRTCSPAAYSYLFESQLESFLFTQKPENSFLWADLVPSSHRSRFLARIPNPDVRWRRFFAEPDWRDLVHRAALTYDLTNQATILPPLVVGFLLVQSGYLKTHLLPHVRTHLEWLAQVCYHGPGRRMIVDQLRGGKKNSRPGPPRALFRPPSTVASLGDVLRDRGVALVPTGKREGGQPVFEVNKELVYWKEDMLFRHSGDTGWVEISILDL